MNKRHIFLLITIPFLVALLLGVMLIALVQPNYGTSPPPPKDYLVISHQTVKSHLWYYTILGNDIENVSVSLPKCFITESGDWWTQTEWPYTVYNIWGANSHLSWQMTDAYWYPHDDDVQLYFIVYYAGEPTNGFITVNGFNYRATVPSCGFSTYLPLVTN